MNNAEYYVKETMKKIQDYLDVVITDEEASSWALKVIIETKKLEELPEKVLSAIQCLADLHDREAPWCPTREQLKRWKTELEKNHCTNKKS